MTVYFAGTERLDFETQAGNVTTTTSSSYRNSTNSRVAVALAAGSDDTNYVDAPLSAAATEFWLHFVGYIYNATTNKFVKLYSSGTLVLGVATISTTAIGIYKWTGSAWSLLLTIDASALSGAWYQNVRAFDLHVKVGNPGTLAFYIDGVPYGATTSVDLSAISNVDKVRFQPSYSISGNYISEVIVADWNTVGSKIVSSPPTGNSTTNTAWTGDYTSVDEATDGGTDYVTSGTANQRETYTYTAFPALASGESIAAIGVGVEAFTDTSAPQNINLACRISGTDYDGADRTLNTSPTYRQKVWETNPATSLAWTLSGANGAEYGFRSRT